MFVGCTVFGALTVHLAYLLIAPAPFGFDMMFVHNALWNLASGRWAFSDLIGQNIYAAHAFFNLPLFFPFYLLDHPYWLNIGHCLFGTAAAYVFYRSGGISLALIYLLFPATSGFLLVECQPSISGVPFLAAYFLFKERKKPAPAFLCGMLASFGYEPFILAMFMEGILEAVKPECGRRLGLALMCGTTVTLLLFLFNAAESDFVSGSRHYTALGGSPLGAIKLLLADPRALGAHVFMKAKMGFIFHLLFPVFFLPLLVPRLLLVAAPELILVLLADPGDDMYKINAFYTHVTTVVIVVAAGRIIGSRRKLAMALVANVAVLQFAYHHTLIPQTPGKAEAILQSGFHMPSTMSFDDVPEGARVLIEKRSEAALFPKRAVLLPDPFLAPRIYEEWSTGRLDYDYVVRGGKTLRRQ